MSITHEQCRDVVAAGDPSAGDGPVASHLVSCPTCRAFAASVAVVDEEAAALAPPPAPPGLTDRVVAALPATPPRPPGLVRRWQTIVVLAAAVMLIAGLASSVLLDDPGTRRDDRQVLLAAARHFEEDGPQRVRVDASTHIEVAADGRNPDFSQVPPEVRDHMAQQWDRIMTELDRQIADLDRRIDNMLSEFDRHLDESFGGARPSPPAERPGRRPPVEAAPEDSRPSPPDAASLSLRIRAAGVIDPSGTVQLDGLVTPVAGTLAVPTTQAEFAIEASAEARAVRAPDGTWVQAEQGNDLMGTILLDANAIPAILRAARGSITSETSSAGQAYRFTIDGQTVGAGSGAWSATAIVRDDRVHQLTLAPAPERSGPVSTRLTIDVVGGASVDPGRRPVSIVGPVGASPSPLAPIAPAVRAALEGESR